MIDTNWRPDNQEPNEHMYAFYAAQHDAHVETMRDWDYDCAMRDAGEIPLWGYEEPTHLATPREAMLEHAHNAGMDEPDRCWILTPFDTWERNPFYSGPTEPHPEDDWAYEFIAEHGIEAWRKEDEKPFSSGVKNFLDDEIPF